MCVCLCVCVSPAPHSSVKPPPGGSHLSLGSMNPLSKNLQSSMTRWRGNVFPFAEELRTIKNLRKKKLKTNSVLHENSVDDEDGGRRRRLPACLFWRCTDNTFRQAEGAWLITGIPCEYYSHARPPTERRKNSQRSPQSLTFPLV